MQQRKRNSIFLFYAQQIAGSIWNLFAKSVGVQWLCNASSRLEGHFRQGAFRTLSDAEDGHHAWQFRLRRSTLQSAENSAILRFVRWIANTVFQTSVSSVGFFLLFCGAFSVLLGVSHLALFFGKWRLTASVLLMAASLPLLSSNHSVYYALTHSLIAGTFLFDFCAIPKDRYMGERAGKARHLQMVILSGIIAFGVGMVPLKVLLFLALFLLSLLLFAEIPELFTCLILFSFPFLRLIADSGAILGGMIVCNDLLWLRKALCGKRILRFGAIDWTILLLSLLFLFGGLFGAGGKEGVKNGILLSVLLSFWYPVTDFFSQKKWKYRGIFVWKLAALIAASWGIAEYFFADLELRFVDVSRFSDLGGRVMGPFSNPNFFAEYLLLGIPFFLAGALDTTEKMRSRMLHAVGTAWLLLALLFTWTRGAWLGCLVAVLLLFVVYSKTSFGILLLATLPVISALPLLPHRITNRFLSIGSFTESSIRYRLYTWKGVLRMICENPWGIGTGDAAFHRIYPGYAVSGTESVMHAHQLGLQICTELGLPGFLTVSFFLLQILFFAARGLRTFQGRTRALFTGAMCALVGIWIMGFFDDVWYHSGLFCMFFVICSLLTEEDYKYENGT